MSKNKTKEVKVGNIIANIFEGLLKEFDFETIKELSKSLDLSKHTAKTTLKNSVILIESVQKKKRIKNIYHQMTLEELQSFQPSGVISEKIIFDSLNNFSDENTTNGFSSEVITYSGKLLQSIMASRIVSENKSNLEHSKWKSLSNRIQKQKEQALTDLQNSLKESLY